MLARLELINTLNDLQGSLNGLDANCGYAIGDILGCKLNILRRKQPRRNDQVPARNIKLHGAVRDAPALVLKEEGMLVGPYAYGLSVERGVNLTLTWKSYKKKAQVQVRMTTDEDDFISNSPSV